MAEALVIAEAVTGIDARMLSRASRVGLLDSALHAPQAGFGDDGRTLREDAINGDFRAWDLDQDGSYAAPGEAFAHHSTWERLHPLGDVMSSVLGAGMTVELFHEWDHTPAPTPWLVEGDDGMWRFPDGATAFPLLYSMRARLPGLIPAG